MTQQKYKTGASEEYIISGNDALMKCYIPSFMSDFVTVTSWVSSEGVQIYAGTSFGNNTFETKIIMFEEGIAC